LALTAILLAVFTLLAYLGYVFFLGQSSRKRGKCREVSRGFGFRNNRILPASSLLEVSL